MIFVTEPSVKKTTDAYKGEYAALIQTVQLGTTKGSGTLFTGKFILDLQNPLNSTKFGVPFTDKPVYLKGFYKYIPVSGDSCRIASSLTKWNSNTKKRDTVAFATISHSQSMTVVNTYTEFDIIYNYRSSDTPDSITVVFASSADGANYNAAVGSKLYIDEISLEYFPLSAEKFQNKLGINVYPNPVSDFLIIESTNDIDGRLIKIFNSNGSLFKTKTLNQSREELNISDLPKGMYFYSIDKKNGTIETGKFVIK
jgi:hypothetical protein